MTVAYPLKSQKDYTELKYSLRSIDRFLKNPFEVLIIGETLPDWITGVTWLDVPDIPSKKQLTIKAKILAALEYSEEILFMNDDVFLITDTDPENHPYYFHGHYNLAKVGESGAKALYNQLTAMNKPVKFYDGHYPLIYGRDFKNVMENFTEETIIKSAYCNYLEIEGVDIADNKLSNEKKPAQIFNFIKDKPSFSTGANSIKSAKPILEKLFPNKSKFEV